MARSDRAIPESDAANLARLRQVTARIRARAAEGVPLPGARRPPLPRQRVAPAAPQHWSDGPESEEDEPGEP